MQIVHDSSGKKKPMQVVDDGKETKLKKFDGVDIPEQETQDNSEVGNVVDDSQAVHDEQTTESTPTEIETESTSAYWGSFEDSGGLYVTGIGFAF